MVYAGKGFSMGESGQYLYIRSDGGLSVPQEVLFNIDDVKGLAEASQAALEYMQSKEYKELDPE